MSVDGAVVGLGFRGRHLVDVTVLSGRSTCRHHRLGPPFASGYTRTIKRHTAKPVTRSDKLHARGLHFGGPLHPIFMRCASENSSNACTCGLKLPLQAFSLVSISKYLRTINKNQLRKRIRTDFECKILYSSLLKIAATR